MVLSAPATCGETENLPGSFTSTSPLAGQQNQQDFGVSLPQPPPNLRKRIFVAKKHPQALANPARRRVERFHRNDAGTHILPLDGSLQADQHGGAFFQQIAVLIEPFLKQDCLILTGRVRELDDPHLGTRLCPALGAVEHRRREPPGGRALLDGADEFGPGLNPQTCEDRRIGIKRMAGQKESDTIELAPQPLVERPGLNLRQRNRARAFAAKQNGLAGKPFFLAPVCGGENGFGGGKDTRAAAFQFIKGASGGETFERALVDFARIEFCRKFTDIAEYAAWLAGPLRKFSC